MRQNVIDRGIGMIRRVFTAQDFSGPQAVFNRGGGEPPKYNFILPHFWAYRNVDARLRKDLVPLHGQKLGVTVDVFNAINRTNYGRPNSVLGNQDFGTIRSAMDMRILQLGLKLYY